MPCPAKPASSIWTGISECDFVCINGTQQIESRCEPCPNARAPNSSWLDSCEWTCGKGLRQVEGQCLACAQNKPNNSRWLDLECQWQCVGGYIEYQGDCTECVGGKDFRSHWTDGCNWQCDPGFTRNAIGCGPCEMTKDPNSFWSRSFGCEWECNTGYAKQDGICKQCTQDLDDRGRWAPEIDEACGWVCKDGFFLLKPYENAISLPMIIALSCAAGVVLALIAIRCCCWKRPKTFGRAAAIDEAHAKGLSLYDIPVSVGDGPTSAPLQLTNGLVYDEEGNPAPYPPEVPKIVLPSPSEELLKRRQAQLKQEEKRARQLTRARNRVQEIVADVATLVSRPPTGAPEVADEIAI